MVSNTLYDTLSAFAKFILPALGTFYLAIAGLWGFPFGEQIVGTLIALEAFLGAILLFMKARYKQEFKIVSVPKEPEPDHEDPGDGVAEINGMFEQGTDPDLDYDPKHA